MPWAGPVTYWGCGTTPKHLENGCNMARLAATRHTEATRKAIVEAAAELFLDRRPGGFSVQDVADRVGLTHRTVYRYFPTRQELMGAAAQYLAPGFAEDSFGEVSTVEEWID